MSKEKQQKIQQNLTIRLMRLLRYNKARNERALTLIPPSKRPLYHLLPFLIHVNHPSFPGYVDNENALSGLNHYPLRDELQEALEALFPVELAQIENIKKIWPEKRCIESLMLMGSIGSIAQSAKSDFDYWVCIDNQKLTEQQLELLQQKLTLVEQWADQQHDLEVHFFISDMAEVRDNNFGSTDGESSGSAQPIFLKSEFYTTHIVVAGKAPYWWFMPDAINQQQYVDLIEALKGGEIPDPKFFMDLGYLEKMDSRELFGAAIWQITKGMDSPFKSVLKMAKIEVFLENIDQRQPLCNTLRKKVHSGVQGPGGLECIDPYALMFDELIQYYTKAENNQVVKLLQLCLYIKCNSQLSMIRDRKNMDFKQQIIASYVKSWGWSDQKIAKVDRIKRWSFKEKYELSKQIHSFLVMCYRRVSERLDASEQNVSNEDMTVLGRKIDTYYSKKPKKVEYLRSAFENELYYKVITIKAELDPGLKREWTMYSDNVVNIEDDALDKVKLRKSISPIELIIWAVTNRIMDSKSKILLGYKTDPVTEDDLHKLSLHTTKLFPPVRVSEISREVLLKQRQILTCMAIVNFESRRFKPDIETIHVIYSTSWGEVYRITEWEQVTELKAQLKENEEKADCYFLVSDTAHKSRLMEDFVKRTGMKGWQII